MAPNVIILCLALISLCISSGPYRGMWEDIAIPAHIPSQMSPWLQDLLWALRVALQQPLSCLSAVRVQSTSGGSCAKETCSHVLWLTGILFAASLGHQRTSLLTSYIACGCWYMPTFFSAATVSPADIQALALSPATRLSLPFLTLPSLPPSTLLHKPLITAWEIICFSDNPFCFLFPFWLVRQLIIHLLFIK